MSGERVASYHEFMNILEDADAGELCNAPTPAQIDGLMEGVDVILVLEEMGCNFSKFQNPYHHRVRATILFEYRTYHVDILDTVWQQLRTIEEWQRALPVITVSAEALEQIHKALDEEDPEEGGTGVRKPATPPAPSDDAGASIPQETPVG